MLRNKFYYFLALWMALVVPVMAEHTKESTEEGGEVTVAAGGDALATAAGASRASADNISSKKTHQYEISGDGETKLDSTVFGLKKRDFPNWYFRMGAQYMNAPAVVGPGMLDFTFGIRGQQADINVSAAPRLPLSREKESAAFQIEARRLGWDFGRLLDDHLKLRVGGDVLGRIGTGDVGQITGLTNLSLVAEGKPELTFDEDVVKGTKLRYPIYLRGELGLCAGGTYGNTFNKNKKGAGDAGLGAHGSFYLWSKVVDFMVDGCVITADADRDNRLSALAFLDSRIAFHILSDEKGRSLDLEGFLKLAAEDVSDKTVPPSEPTAGVSDQKGGWYGSGAVGAGVAVHF